MNRTATFNIQKDMQPTLHATVDWNSLCAIWGAFIALMTAIIGVLSYNHKYKIKKLEFDKQLNEEFIKKVAIACVNATLDGILKDVKDDINKLFKLRDDDRNHWDKRFDSVITAINK